MSVTLKDGDDWLLLTSSLRSPNGLLRRVWILESWPGKTESAVMWTHFLVTCICTPYWCITHRCAAVTESIIRSR